MWVYSFGELVARDEGGGDEGAGGGGKGGSEGKGDVG